MADDDSPSPAPPAPADRGKRPRSLAWVAASALAATLVVALVLVARSGDERPIRTVAADRDNTATTSSTTEASTSVPPTTTTTVQAATKTAEPTTSAPTTTAPVSSCSDSDITVTVETDKATYATGEEVHINVFATNTSGHDCPPSRGAAIRVLRADGTVVYDLPAAVASRPPGARWPAGETWRADPQSWDQRCDRGSCEGVQQPPGEYTVEAKWYRYGSARTTIRIN